jgi:Cu(I)/Ag(I) efflux system membrane protein CusA/SilA
MLRNFVRLNVRGRGVVDFVEEARRIVAAKVALPTGVSVAWTGQFEHEIRATKTLIVVIPVVILLIFAVLFWTFRDLADAFLMLLAVPGSIAGGLMFQWLLGFPFTVTTWVGYIACFGMATSTGIIMLVYLRGSIAKSGGIETLSLEGLRSAVLSGAANRLRPKLLTEGITILGLAPMLWADGPGAEVIRPMAAPVLGGLLVADEVIDLLLPVLFYHIRKRRWLSFQENVEV